MTQPTISLEQAVEWIDKAIDAWQSWPEAVKAQSPRQLPMLQTIRAALTAQALPVDGNRLPLEEIPEGWKFLELCAAINNRFYVELMRAKAGGFPPYERKLAYGATPAEALRAAIAAAAKDGAS